MMPLRFPARGLLLSVGTLLLACHSDSIASLNAGATDRTITVGLGQEVRITLQTIGPGNYDSLPALSSTAVRFLDMAYLGPFVPAGPTQLFRFSAVARGTTIIVFHSSDMNPAVQDTVIVR